MTSVLVNISAGKESVSEPWIWRISRDFNVKVIIVRANVDTDFGFMQIDLQGEVEDVQRTIAWLMTTGLHVEAQSRSVGA
jgi:L-aspartate semialdehyde sulfurtransferase ferredoxin